MSLIIVLLMALHRDVDITQMKIVVQCQCHQCIGLGFMLHRTGFLICINSHCYDHPLHCSNLCSIPITEYNANLPSGPQIQPSEYPSPLLAASTNSATDALPSLMQNKPSSVGLTTPLIGSFQSLSLLNTCDVNVPIPPVSNKPSVPFEVPTPSLVTPGQLLQLGLASAVSSQPTQAVHKDVEVLQMSPTPASEPVPPVPVAVPTEAQPPILPLPPQPRVAPTMNGAPYQNRQNYNYRGRDRGGIGYGGSRSVMKFTEEFDFSAMNEKFNKDEIWDTLGKTNKKENDGIA